MTIDERLTLYLQYRNELIHYAYALVQVRECAEDLVQEAWLKFAELNLLNIEQPAGYLFRMVRNLAVDQLRCQKRLNCQQNAADIAPTLCCQALEPAYAAAQSRALERLLNALEALDSQTRSAFEMHRFAGCTLEQIAQTLNTSQSSAHRLVQQGVAHCLSALGES